MRTLSLNVSITRLVLESPSISELVLRLEDVGSFFNPLPLDIAPFFAISHNPFMISSASSLSLCFWKVA